MSFQEKRKILITGSNGMVGKSLVKKLKSKNFNNLVLPNSKELDLRARNDVENYFLKIEKNIDYVFHLAAKVGGIEANITSPLEFMRDNLLININIIDAAYKSKVKKLLFLGSSCIYPRECLQPMREEFLLTDKLEPTNEGYAISKICGLKLCELYNRQYKTNFISLMPPNLYGVNDHFNEKDSHVLSALITRFYAAKKRGDREAVVWGTGNARREFLYDEDLCDAMIYFMEKYDAKEIAPFINVGNGEDISIKDLAFLIKELMGFEGEIIFDSSKPDGMPRKLMDSSRARSLGWQAKTPLRQGLEKTIRAYQKRQEEKADQ